MVTSKAVRTEKHADREPLRGVRVDWRLRRLRLQEVHAGVARVDARRRLRDCAARGAELGERVIGRRAARARDRREHRSGPRAAPVAVACVAVVDAPTFAAPQQTALLIGKRRRRHGRERVHGDRLFQL